MHLKDLKNSPIKAVTSVKLGNKPPTIMPSRIIFVVYLSHFLLCSPLTGMVISQPGRVLSVHTLGVVIRQASILLVVVKLEIKGHLSCHLHAERYYISINTSLQISM